MPSGDYVGGTIGMQGDESRIRPGVRQPVLTLQCRDHGRRHLLR